MKKNQTKSKSLFNKIKSTGESDLNNYYNTKKPIIFIIKSLYHNEITNSMAFDFIDNLPDVYKNKVIVFEVPGAFEIPLIIKQTLDKYGNKNREIYILALGCVIKGQTKHDEYISSTIINAIRNLSLEYNTFIINGILTTLTTKQAIERAGIKHRKGKEYAEGLSVMSQLINKLR
ncbi:MAG: 6,7-dimethyl-8-ribityllumazine synthase [Pseudomonadota bacterium]|nr:6,7-dimethyl-8-ribityllumazine synthase [Pseudomonadota bacterium]